MLEQSSQYFDIITITTMTMLAYKKAVQKTGGGTDDYGLNPSGGQTLRGV